MIGKGGTRNEINGGIFISPVIQGRDITLRLPPEITPALSGLPPGTPAFTGRDIELHILLGILAPSPLDEDSDVQPLGGGPASAVVVAAVGGLAGVGKTELAIQAAHTAQDRGWFPGGVLFVDLFGYDPTRSLEPGEALEGFLRALAIPAEHIPPQTQDRARLYASVLDAYAREGRRILVVIDNAATHEQAKPLLPVGPPNMAIVTSRDTLGLLDAWRLDLDALAPDDAADMLDRVLQVSHPGDTRIVNHRDDAARIAQLCGQLPLALRIIAALLSENRDRRLDELAKDLDDERTRLDDLSYAPIGVRAAFDLSYLRLNPDHTRLFRLLIVNPGPEISTQATAVLADIDQGAARRGLEALARAHLISSGGHRKWQMHDLVRLYANQLSDAHSDADGREQARDQLLDYYIDTTRAAHRHLESLPRTSLPGVFADRDEALAWLDGERPSLVAAVTMAANRGRDQAAMRLSLYLDDYLSWRRRFDELLSVAKIGREAAHRLGERRNEANILITLGDGLEGFDRFEEAVAAYQDAAAIFQEVADRHGEGRALNHLGYALARLGRFEEAVAAHQNAVAIFQEIRDRQGEGAALDNLGLAMQQLGRFEEAVAAHQDAAAIFQEIGDRHGEGIALTTLGFALTTLGRVEEAVAAHQNAVAIFQETRDRWREGRGLDHLGFALQRLERFEEAIATHQDALAIDREIGDWQGEGMVLDHLGLALLELDRLEEAVAAHRDAAAILQETGHRPAEGMALGNLGRALQKTPRLEEAISAHQESVAIYREIGDRQGEGTALDYLGLALQKVRRLEEAVVAHRAAVAILQEVGNRDDEGMALNHLGFTLLKLGRFEAAIAPHQDAAAIFQEIGNRQGEGTALDDLGLALLGLGRFEEAVAVHENAVAIFQEIGDREGEARTLDTLGLGLRGLTRFEEAIAAHENAMTIFLKLGDGRGVGMALTNLGITLREGSQND